MRRIIQTTLLVFIVFSCFACIENRRSYETTEQYLERRYREEEQRKNSDKAMQEVIDWQAEHIGREKKKK